MVDVPDRNLLPLITEAEQTPTVRLLMVFIEQQQKTILKQHTDIEALKAEVARFKKFPKSQRSGPARGT